MAGVKEVVRSDMGLDKIDSTEVGAKELVRAEVGV